MQDILASERVSMQGMLACEHVSTPDTLVPENVSMQDMLGHEQVSMQFSILSNILKFLLCLDVDENDFIFYELFFSIH